MKRLLLGITLISAAMGLTTSCNNGGEKPQQLVIDNSLTEAEKAAGILTAEVMWKMGRIGEHQLSPDGKTLIYTVTYYNMQENKSTTNLYSMPAGGGDAKQLTDNTGRESSPQWSADGSKLYFLSNRSGSNQLWSMNADGSDMKQLSDIPEGIDGYGIAPTGDKLWYAQRVKVDKVTAKDIHPDMEKSSAMIYDDLMARHWDTWTDGTYSHLFVTDFDGNTAAPGKDIMPNEPWDAPLAPYYDMAEISWSNNGKQLAYTCKKLKGKDYAMSTDSDIYIYDTQEGSTKNITEGMPGYDKYPRFSPDDTMVAFSSMERAGNESDKTRLMVFNLATGDMNYVTKDFDYYAENIIWDGNNALLFSSPMQATYQICKADPTTGAISVLTSGEQDYNTFSLAGDKLVAAKTTLSMATELFDIDKNTGDATQLTFVNKDIYDNIKMGEVRKRMVKTTDNKEMLTWVILPPDFDSTKSYPTLLYCQGGPQSVVSQFWSYRWNFQLMAAQGYIVVAPNRRGLPSFGQEWNDQISGDYSGQNIRDYLSAIDDVSKEPWADRDRMGCVGASYGGYSTYFLAGNHEKRFKAFIAHCGMFNFESFYASTEEMWFPNNDIGGPYWSDSPVAKRSYANSPHKFIDKWDTPILIFSGLNDFRIPYTENLQAFNAARMRDIPARLVTFSDEAHQIFKPQNSVVWNREFFNWLDKYVKNPQKTPVKQPRAAENQ